MEAINLHEKLSLFSTHWDPHVIADYNENDVMVVRFKGEYPFHKHDTTDDFFLVLEGEMVLDIEGEPSRTVRAGEMIVVPRGVVHRPRAENEVKVLLIEPKGEPNSGDAATECFPPSMRYPVEPLAATCDGRGTGRSVVSSKCSQVWRS